MTPLEFAFCAMCLLPIIGMAFAFALCQNCQCGTTGCCGGSFPGAGFDVHIELTDADCDLCDEVWSGTFSVSFLTGCTWYYDSGLASISPPVTPIIGCRVADIPQYRFVYRRQVYLSILRVGSNYQIDLYYEVAILECDGSSGYPPSTTNCYQQTFKWNWQKIVAVASFDCATASAYAIPRTDRETSGSDPSPVWPCNATDSTRADATITALA